DDRRVALLGDLIDRHADRVDDVRRKEKPRYRGEKDCDRRNDEPLTELAEVLAERHSLVALVAPPPGSGGHARQDFGLGELLVVLAAGLSASAAAESSTTTSSPFSSFIVLTSLRKMRIDWPRLRASPGSLGAPNSRRMIARTMTRC